MADKTPGQIVVWVCPTCGYWRQERSTSVHQVFLSGGMAEMHDLAKAAYIYEGEAE